MHTPFREHHLIQAATSFEEQSLPLDLFLSRYFRAHKAVGSKDRKVICEALYKMMRHKKLIDYLLMDKKASWSMRYQAYLSYDLNKLQTDTSIPPATRISFPDTLYHTLKETLGEKKALEFCRASNEKAPVTVRVNTLLISREELFKRWKRSYRISPCKHSPEGITFQDKINFFGLPEFKQGLFEVQDEGSQLVANLVDTRPKQLVLDYCAGAGGKALAIAPKLKGGGQLFLHDIRDRALQEAKKRLKRAGIQNAQLLLHSSPNKSRLHGKMDWVLVDAPCSGTGTLRRNPDMKWRFQPEMIDRLVKEQREIFEEALAYVKPGGHIVYATCSVLPQENENQVAFFEEEFGLERQGEYLATSPAPGQMDGFFGVVLKKTTR